MMREIVETGIVSQTIDSYNGAIPRLEEAWDALKWLLSRSPELGIPLAKETPQLRVYKSKGLAGLPDLVTLYNYSESQVHVHTILVLVDESPALREIQKAKA